MAKLKYEKVVLVGHSHGDKVVFGVALKVGRNTTMQQSSVVMGLDPIDGTCPTEQTVPPILQYSKDLLNLGMPTLIVGTWLGPMHGEGGGEVVSPTMCSRWHQP